MAWRGLSLLIAVTVCAAGCAGRGTAPSGSTAGTTAPAEPASSTGPPAAVSEAPPVSSAPTTTTDPQVLLSPLNGLEVTAETLRTRRVVAVKIDNHPRARPQSGLQEADAVIEVLVEGVTRFIALFHHSDSRYLGPVRSVRPTDSTLLLPLGATFVASGGQAWVRAVTAERGVPFLEEGVEGLFRIPSRYAPQNLYADTVALRAAADEHGYDDDFSQALFSIGEWDALPETSAETITMDWAPGAQVQWRFTGDGYERFGGGSEHRWADVDGNEGPLVFEVLVVIVGGQYTAVPGAGLGGRAVPATDTLGSGRMAIFSGGRVLEGTWERDEITDPFRLLDTQGNRATVPPGVPWISIYPDTQSFRWE